MFQYQISASRVPEIMNIHEKGIIKPRYLHNVSALEQFVETRLIYVENISICNAELISWVTKRRKIKRNFEYNLKHHVNSLVYINI